MYNNELYHHGILGMRWGVRRFQNKNGTLTSAGKKRYSEDDWSDDARNASTINKKSIKQMSNSELKQLNERVRLEQEYSRLNPSAIKKGRDALIATATLTSTALTIYNNSDKIVDIGRKVVNRLNGR